MELKPDHSKNVFSSSDSQENNLKSSCEILVNNFVSFSDTGAVEC